MSVLVEQQDEVINAVETQAGKVSDDVEQGYASLPCIIRSINPDHIYSLAQTGKAVESARRARRMRWICFLIFLTIVVILGLVLGIYFGTRNNN